MYYWQSFAWSLQHSPWCIWCWYCRCNSCWQSHCLGGRSWCRCSWCYITNVGCAWFDSIQMMFFNVVTSTSVLSTTIIGFANDGGREPQVPGVIEDIYGLASKEWRFLVAALLVMVLYTLGGKLVEIVTSNIDMLVSMPDPLWHSSAKYSLA